MIFWSLLMAMSFIFVLTDLIRISMIFYAIALIFAVLFFDLIWKETPNVYRMSFIIGLSMVIFVLTLDPDSVVLKEVNGFTIPFWNGLFSIFSIMTLVVSLIFCFQTAIVL
jgi:hypothetical protein